MIFLEDTFRLPIEKAVSASREKTWSIQNAQDMEESSSHPAAILSDGSYSVFVKFSGAANSAEQFEVELAGLEYLSRVAGVLIPAPIANISVEGGVLMILEAVRAVERTPKQWREIGRTLAQIHSITGDAFGLDAHNYFGPLYQDNRPLSDWSTFYIERRLYPRLMGAINAGNMPSEVIRQVEKLFRRIPALCGPEVTPTLLHGDAQQHNFITAENGAVVIDPAIYYGHPEVDLAYVDFFHAVPEDLFIGYQERLPIDAGFRERRDLWRMYGYLAVVEVEGVVNLPKLTNALRKYL